MKSAPVWLALLPVASWCAQPAFEVASIKPSDPGHVGAQLFSPGPGRLTGLTDTLKDLVQFAYNVRPSQLQGGAHWMESEAFDIAAKAAGNPSTDELRAMLQALLADRFQLKVHRESREQGIYRLTVDKSGSKLKELAAAGRGVGMQKGNLHAFGADMATLANVLSRHLDRLVVDRTGLKGYYDFSLQWSADDLDPAGTALFQAIQQQLGLRLEAARETVDVVVIDSAARPSAN